MTARPLHARLRLDIAALVHNPEELIATGLQEMDQRVHGRPEWRRRIQLRLPPCRFACMAIGKIGAGTLSGGLHPM